MFRRILGATGVALALSASVAAAETVTLKFASPSPAGGQVNDWGLQPWIKDVEQASDGTLELKFFPGFALANFVNLYDRIINNVVDVGFGVMGPLSGQFPKTDVVTLPFGADNCTDASIALWRLIDKGLIVDEYSRIKPLALVAFPGSAIHTKKEIKTLDDLKGLKLANAQRSVATTAALLGGTPITLQTTEYYQGLQRGMVDGTIIGISGLIPFKLQEQVSYHLVAPLGQANGYVFMNKDVYAKLPDKARAAIDRYAYESFSKRLGEVTDKMDEVFTAMLTKLPDHKVYRFPPAQEAEVKKRLAPVTEEWLKTTPNGAAVLAAYRAELNSLRKK
jgi:TRAP-type C4-dicarboxylate transport system substrate-binding protein